MLGKALHALTSRHAPRTIEGDDGDVYLSRWYLLGDRDENEVRSINPFLHCIHRSDQDKALHSHPWTWGISIILVKGYSEEIRRPDGTVERRRMRPGMINFIRADTFHRLDLIDGEEAWTLFIAGPRTKDGQWWFWDRYTDMMFPWQVFLRMKALMRQKYERTSAGIEMIG